MNSNWMSLEFLPILVKFSNWKFWSVRTPTTEAKDTVEMLVQKLDYMHLNPMQPHWLLCNNPAEYKFSSAIFYEQQLDEFGILTNFSEVF